MIYEIYIPHWTTPDPADVAERLSQIQLFRYQADALLMWTLAKLRRLAVLEKGPNGKVIIEKLWYHR